ncbi:Oidioi.mRNA.OKI2018_I69.XSR.g16459.t2.cds [Oikopleura dioica]|uniref:Oidioi.mRNA.OKI2018_I69.XSR.g16459.t2.cds n=1 Tax=Oikopleura dioica TaxID=34765 RepID=A0ABN7SK69_OIKDI|nr:Oidioi.mRNA.OKI2018_I69.XSR.g16459.t2.cds [Oikopleura dioica]
MVLGCVKRPRLWSSLKESGKEAKPTEQKFQSEELKSSQSHFTAGRQHTSIYHQVSPRRHSSSSFSRDNFSLTMPSTSGQTVEASSSSYRTPESFWYKPTMSRDEAIKLLKGSDRKAGDFLVRDSKTYSGNFGLVVRVDRHQVPQSVFDNLRPDQDPESELVRHFLIESVKEKGVRISGDDRREPFFPSLAALIHQHGEDRSESQTSGKIVVDGGTRPPADVFCTFFLHETDTEMLTGRAAMERCMAEYLSLRENVKCPVHLKITSEGVTVTDSQRLKFFRKHFPAETVSFCDFDPHSRVHQSGKVFGLVAKKPNNNSCILFTEKDLKKAPAGAIIESINKIMTRPRINDINSYSS